MSKASKIFADVLSDLVDERKKEKNIPQSKIAEELGISTGALSKYMSDDAEIKIGKLEAIASYFNVSADYLVGLVNEPTIDKDLKMICKYTGLSEKAVESLSNLSGSEYIAFLNQILEHDNFSKFLHAIYIYQTFKGVRYTRPTFGEVVEQNRILADLFECPPSNVKYYLDKYSASVVQESIMEIVEDIDFE